MRPQRPCLGCGALTRNPGGRCRTCQQKKDRARNQLPHRQAYNDTDYRTARRQARLGYYGPCVDCGTWDDLTLDHKIPLILGGRNHPSNWVVRCRPCNSTKGTTVELDGTEQGEGRPTPAQTDPPPTPFLGNFRIENDSAGSRVE